MTFTPEQNAALSAPLNSAHVAQRRQGGSQVSYIEGWHAIAEANRIFGFDAWCRETDEIRCVSERERKIGQQQKDGWAVTYICRVRVRVGNLMREGCGAGHGIDADLGQAHESAIKEAETDAMKRALMTFGNPFGLALYDKSHANVQSAPKADPVPAKRGPLPADVQDLLDDIACRDTQAALRTLWEAKGQDASNGPHGAIIKDAFNKRKAAIELLDSVN